MYYRLHRWITQNSMRLLVFATLTISVGGIVEITPTFYLESTIEKVAGMRPYTPLELAGRNIYVREGCYACHSQMIRTLKDEADRYGHYSLAAESMYDHPHQWGSKRTGPDLARVGGKYSDYWHVVHLKDPQSVVPESVMPPYAFLAERPLRTHDIRDHLITNERVGVPYTPEMIEKAEADLKAQLDPYADDIDGFMARYPKAQAREFDGNPKAITEMDALVAYLQMLGTLAELNTYKLDENTR